MFTVLLLYFSYHYLAAMLLSLTLGSYLNCYHLQSEVPI